MYHSPRMYAISTLCFECHFDLLNTLTVLSERWGVAILALVCPCRAIPCSPAVRKCLCFRWQRFGCLRYGRCGWSNAILSCHLTIKRFTCLVLSGIGRCRFRSQYSNHEHHYDGKHNDRNEYDSLTPHHDWATPLQVLSSSHRWPLVTCRQHLPQWTFVVVESQPWPE